MHITNLEEYGLRCFIQVAKNFERNSSISASEIAQREGLSVDYVAKIMHIFKKASLIVSKRGQFGGFSLARDPEEISLAEVLSCLKSPKEKLLQENFCMAFRGEKDHCVHQCECSIRPLWQNVFSLVDELFAKVKISVFLNSEIKTDQIVKNVLKDKVYEIF